MVRAGRLRDRVTIEEKTDGDPDAKGTRSPSWSAFATRWARIVPLTGREMYTADQVYAEATHRIELRYLADITPAMRVTFGSRVFDIEGVINDERMRETHLLVSEDV